MLDGFKTFAVGLGLSTLPQLIAFTTNFDFVHAFGLSPNAATLVGIVIIALRSVTSTPIFQGKEPMDQLGAHSLEPPRIRGNTMCSKALGAAVAALACVALVGCAGNGAMSPTVTADLQQALAVGCPVFAAIRASGSALDKYQKAANATLSLACPPNPPPTSAVVAVEDIIAAYATLRPLVKR